MTEKLYETDGMRFDFTATVLACRKTENGYEVVCRVSGGDVTLLSFTLYAPDAQQAEVIKLNFLSYPRTVYKTMLGLMTKDIENVGGALEEVYGTLV